MGHFTAGVGDGRWSRILTSNFNTLMPYAVGVNKPLLAGESRLIVGNATTAVNACRRTRQTSRWQMMRWRAPTPSCCPALHSHSGYSHAGGCHAIANAGLSCARRHVPSAILIAMVTSPCTNRHADFTPESQSACFDLLSRQQSMLAGLFRPHKRFCSPHPPTPTDCPGIVLPCGRRPLLHSDALAQNLQLLCAVVVCLVCHPKNPSTRDSTQA